MEDKQENTGSSKRFMPEKEAGIRSAEEEAFVGMSNDDQARVARAEVLLHEVAEEFRKEMTKTWEGRRMLERLKAERSGPWTADRVEILVHELAEEFRKLMGARGNV
jgi:hypothetical protein